MSEIIIKNLSKKYELSHATMYVSNLRESLYELLRFPFSSSKKKENACIWALKDVSFEVNKGEVLGIIGRNGSGKSTLLKILSKVTVPTVGTVAFKGRVSSLLEVGTGFHRELTGRENIFFNGAVLGMKHAQIKKRLDEIVHFSEVEGFLDVPVKRYSSGMLIRLAFSVAAFLDPDILIMDEALAIGDSSFQKKCLDRINNLQKEGATILVVSHSIGAVRKLCNRALLLNKGEMIFHGNVNDTLNLYLNQGREGVHIFKSTENYVLNAQDKVIIDTMTLSCANGELRSTFSFDEAIIVSVTYTVLVSFSFSIGIKLYDGDGNLLFFSVDGTHPEWSYKKRMPGAYESKCIIPPFLFSPNEFFISLVITQGGSQQILCEENCLSYSIINDGKIAQLYGDFNGELPPALLPPVPEWKVIFNSR